MPASFYFPHSQTGGGQASIPRQTCPHPLESGRRAMHMLDAAFGPLWREPGRGCDWPFYRAAGKLAKHSTGDSVTRHGRSLFCETALGHRSLQGGPGVPAKTVRRCHRAVGGRPIRAVRHVSLADWTKPDRRGLEMRWTLCPTLHRPLPPLSASESRRLWTAPPGSLGCFHAQGHGLTRTCFSFFSCSTKLTGTFSVWATMSAGVRASHWAREMSTTLSDL